MESNGSNGQTPRDPELDALILLCCNWVFAQALADGSTEQDASEMSQVAALRLIQWPNAARHPRGKWMDKLYVQCIQEVQRGRSKDLPIDEQTLPAPSPADHELLRKLQEAIARLPAREGYVLRQCKLGNCSAARVAEDLKLKVNHVHLLDSRARKHLQQFLRHDREEGAENS